LPEKREQNSQPRKDQATFQDSAPARKGGGGQVHRGSVADRVNLLFAIKNTEEYQNFGGSMEGARARRFEVNHGSTFLIEGAESGNPQIQTMERSSADVKKGENGRGKGVKRRAPFWAREPDVGVSKRYCLEKKDN